MTILKLHKIMVASYFHTKETQRVFRDLISVLDPHPSISCPPGRIVPAGSREFLCHQITLLADYPSHYNEWRKHSHSYVEFRIFVWDTLARYLWPPGFWLCTGVGGRWETRGTVLRLWRWPPGFRRGLWCSPLSWAGRNWWGCELSCGISAASGPPRSYVDIWERNVSAWGLTALSNTSQWGPALSSMAS